MCQCHTICQSEGDMQVQVAHNKKIPLGEKNSFMGCQLFSGRHPRRGGGGYKKIRVNFFPPPPLGAATRIRATPRRVNKPGHWRLTHCIVRRKILGWAFERARFWGCTLITWNRTASHWGSVVVEPFWHSSIALWLLLLSMRPTRPMIGRRSSAYSCQDGVQIGAEVAVRAMSTNTPLSSRRTTWGSRSSIFGILR